MPEAVSQSKARPGTNSATRQTAVGAPFAAMRKRRPSASGPASSGATRRTDAAHSGQRSTPASTSHTVGGGASMRIVRST